ncbi:MAG: ATP-binding protein [Salinivirgaceae bacterium]
MIQRTLKNEIIEHLGKKEITIISGARQVGKTTMLREIIEELRAQQQMVLFLNLDIDAHSVYFVSQETLLKKIALEIGSSGYVFIDEIQRLDNAGLFLKGLYDRNLNYKFVITGSGSLELKEKIKESLAGRKRLFEMEPVTFTEFTNYKTNYKYINNLPLFYELEKQQTQELLLEYLNYGGYPRIVTETTLSEKLKLMDEIFSSYVEKDLVYLLKIERPEVFHLLIRLLASQTGNIINHSELASHCGSALPTLKRYLYYAEKTFCINYVSPYFTNPLKELTKSPTYYFSDIGLRNFALGQMGTLSLPNQLGFVFQNFVFNLLKTKFNQSHTTLHYWRTTDKAEVDFVVKRPSAILPIEVKYSELNTQTISRSFRSFIAKYKPAEAWIINRNFESELKIDETNIRFLPFYKINEQ